MTSPTRRHSTGERVLTVLIVIDVLAWFAVLVVLRDDMYLWLARRLDDPLAFLWVLVLAPWVVLALVALELLPLPPVMRWCVRGVYLVLTPFAAATFPGGRHGESVLRTSLSSLDPSHADVAFTAAITTWISVLGGLVIAGIVADARVRRAARHAARTGQTPRRSLGWRAAAPVAAILAGILVSAITAQATL